MLLAMVRDLRVIMVKLADRTHNMRTIGGMPPRRRAIAQETLDIYAPIADRLGLYNLARARDPASARCIRSATGASSGN